MTNCVIDLLTGVEQTLSDKSVILTPYKAPLSHQQLLSCIVYIQKLINKNDFTGNNVAMLMPQGSTMAVTILALTSCATCIPINPELSAEEVNFLLEGADVSVIFTLEGFCYSAQSTLDPNIHVVELAENYPWQIDIDTKLCTRHNSIALILHTSGSTAAPKKVCLTHQQLIASCENLTQSLILEKSDVCLNMMPLFHVGGFVDLFLAPLSVGGSVIVGNDSQIETFNYCLKSYQPTWFQGVPTVLRNIVDTPYFSFKKHNFRFIRAVSSPLTVDLEKKLLEIFNVPVIQIYGMSETAGVICSNPLEATKTGSVGKGVGCDVAIIDASGNLAKDNIEGDIIVRGANVITASADHSFVADWLKTGDLGYLDEEGYLFITGRSKEIINRGGEKISPSQIDLLLDGYNGIEEAAAFALPHKTLTEQVALAVVMDNLTEVSDEHIREYLSQHLAPFKLPQKIFRVDALPRTAGGKLQRHLLPSLVSQVPTRIREKTIPTSNVGIFIAKTWKKILKINQVYNEDNFFELGGDSLNAVTMMLALEKRYDLDLPTLILLDNPTLNLLTEYIIGNNADVIANTFSTNTLPPTLEKKLLQVFGSWPGQREYDNSLITGFNTLGDLPPIFWCCQFHEEALSLVQSLDSNQPVYIMRSLHKIVKKNKRDYETLSKRYIEEIIQIQPSGDYYLGGYCAGSYVIFEVAKQLKLINKKVAMLTLLECHVNQPYDGSLALFCGTQRRNSSSAYGLFNYPKMGLGKLYTGATSLYCYDISHRSFLQDKQSASIFVQDYIKELKYVREGVISPEIIKTPPAALLDKAFKKRKIVANVPRIVNQSKSLLIKISLTNTSDSDWQPSEISGITIGSRWRSTKKVRLANAGHLKIDKLISAKSTAEFMFEIMTPDTRGFRWLEIDLIEEGVDWLCSKEKAVFNKMIWVRDAH